MAKPKQTILSTLDGVIERVRSRNEEDWCVMTVRVESGRTWDVTGVTVASEGMTIHAEGEWTDTAYGRQLKAQTIRLFEPSTTEGVTRYLGSGVSTTETKRMGITLKQRGFEFAGSTRY